MNLDEGMPAPASRSKGRRPVPWKIPAAVAAVALTGVLAVTALAASNGGMNATTPEPPPPATSAPAAPADGHDQVLTEADPAAWSTLVAFLDGWASKDPKVRAAVFADTAAKGLADQLVETAPYKVIVQPVEKVEVAGASAMSAEFRVHFRGTTTGPVRVIMVSDGEEGWYVTRIEQIGA